MSRDLLILGEKEVKFLSTKEEVAQDKAESNRTAPVGVVKEVIRLFHRHLRLTRTHLVCLLSEKQERTCKFKIRLQSCVMSSNCTRRWACLCLVVTLRSLHRLIPSS